MNIKDFKRVLSTFADRPADIIYDDRTGTFCAEIRNVPISGKLITKGDSLFVIEDDIEENARDWIKNRVADLPTLANRILTYIHEDKYFVDPCGLFLDTPDTSDEEISINSCMEQLEESLATNIPGATNVLYLISNAGEGKSTLIEQFARIQANKFKNREADWLLVPIPLGGRPFLRFDDIVVASLTNKLRFRNFYYESFIELVKLGLIVPAFDGFEEMYMQNSAGEALTATGELINLLDSNGSILIAARKAYFDYKSFKTQAKLYDSIHGLVVFSKLTIKRWGEDQFCQYAIKRGFIHIQDIYKNILRKLKDPGHPILTRPVLVKQLLNVLTDRDEDFVTSNLNSAVDYFPTFVNSIIEREATEKWIDTSGKPVKPIIPIEAHNEILAILAEEMWLNNTTSIRESVMDLLADVYCEQNKFTPTITRQIKERLKQHALIVRPNSDMPIYKFDHDEFSNYFLGIQISYYIKNKERAEIKNVLRKGGLSNVTVESLIFQIKQLRINLAEVVSFLEECMAGETNFSYIKENIGNITINLINHDSPELTISLENYVFPTDAFANIDISNVKFIGCYIQNTAISKVENCIFKDCQFDRIEIDSSLHFSNVEFYDNTITILYDATNERGYYDNASIEKQLERHGATINRPLQNNEEPIEYDKQLDITERALRRFIRSNTPINDTIFRMRLGSDGELFLRTIMKDLIKYQIIQELPYTGQGQKKRFKLNVPFRKIEEALTSSKGQYQLFLDYFRN